MKKKVSVLICLLCVVFLVLGLAACDKDHKHTTCEICGLCTDTSCTGSTSEKCQGHNTGGDETGGDDPIIGEDTIIKGGLTYQLNDESGVATIIAADSSFNGDIPSKITHSSQGKEYSVTSIGYEAFRGCSGLTSITIPDSVTTIGDNAFRGCSGLTSITVPFIGATKDGTNNTHFGYIFGASSYTDDRTSVPASLKTVIITGGSSIAADAFYNCSSLTSITIPDSVTSIGDWAFIDCSSLASITIPDSVTSIGKGAFLNCSSLTSITLPFVGATKDGTSSTHFGYIFGASSYSDNSTSVPESLKTVIITGGSSIGYEAFYNCSSLTSITIPDSVTSIGEDSFSGCIGLTSATIPTLAIDYIPKSNLKTIVITSGSSINTGAFSGCSSLTSITLPDSVTTIGEDAFSGCCGLTSATIPSLAISYIPKNNLETIVITSGSSINAGAFKDCSSLTSISLPFVGATKDGTDNTHFGYIFGAYSYDSNSRYVPASLKAVIITGGSSIGELAFYGCSSLTSITIPDSVTSIGSSAFSGCSGLTNVTIGNGVTSIGRSAFSGTEWYNNQPDGLVYAGKVAYKYKGTMPSNTGITIKEGTLGIAAEAFYECRSLTSITIPDGVTSIGYDAFRYCSSLTSITLPDSVTSIGDYAFSVCSSLTSITIPDGVTSIGDWAFSGCSGLTNVTIGNGVTTIGEYAFVGCSSLTSITIPDSVTTIGSFAFAECSGLTDIQFSGTKSQWNAISKGSYWNSNTGNYTITCSDGVINK